MAIFGGFYRNSIKEDMQRALSIGCNVIEQHKGDWTSEDVEKLLIDVYSLAMDKFNDHSIICQLPDEVVRNMRERGEK